MTILIYYMRLDMSSMRFSFYDTLKSDGLFFISQLYSVHWMLLLISSSLIKEMLLKMNKCTCITTKDFQLNLPFMFVRLLEINLYFYLCFIPVLVKWILYFEQRSTLAFCCNKTTIIFPYNIILIQQTFEIIHDIDIHV